MLHCILGPAGSGKTHTLFEQLKALPEDTHAILLVPEQATFEYERKMLSLPAGKRAQVLSFTRLCHAVGKEVGGIAGTPLSAEEKLLLMARAVSSCAQELTLYRKQVKQVDFYRHMLTLITECYHKDITPETLLAGSRLLPQGGLSRKLQEIALIFSAYQTLVDARYLDADGQLIRLYHTLEEHPFFTDRVVFVDSFKDFTAPQMKLMGQIIAQSKEVTVALCADGVDQQHNLEIFANTKGTLAKLIRMANRQGAGVCAPTVLTENHRQTTPALKAMEKVLAGKGEPHRGKADEITICSCTGFYDEVTAVAAAIKRLVREDGLRYRDITVVMADPAPYRNLLDGVFARYEIPYFSDAPRPFADQPIAALTLKAMELASLGMDSNRLLSLVKTYLLGFTPQEIALLENYVFTWQIKGADWQKEFTRHPDGKGSPSEELKEQLNRIRLRLITPLNAFCQEGKTAATGKDYAALLYRLFHSFHVFDHLTELAQTLTQNGDRFEGEDLLRSYEILMELLDKIVRASGDTPYTPKEFTHLLSVMIAGCEMGKIPQGIDQVTVGVASRTRPAHCRAMFILGANQGVFPATPSSGGLLTDHDRSRMNEVDIPLSNRCEFDTVEANFLFYHLACQSNEFVTFTYQTADKERALSPCYPLTQIIQLIPGCRQLSARDYFTHTAPLEKAATVDTALELLAESYHQDTPQAGSLFTYFQQHHPQRLGQLQQMETPAPTSLSPHNAKGLFGEAITVSPSGIEVYHKCRFYYFCRYGLRVNAKKPMGIDALARGSMVHYVLEHMLKNHGSKGLSSLTREQMESNVHAMLLQYVEEELGGMEGKSPTFRFSLERIQLLLMTLLTHMAEEMADSLFETAGCEVAIRKGGDLTPYTVALPNGGQLSVIGSIDRVDTYRHQGTTYVRVVDYKTGTKDFCLDDIYYGIGLQMLIYLYAVEQNGHSFGDHRQYAGILYMPAERTEAREGDSAREDLIKSMRMKGLIAHHPDVIHGMDPRATGRYVPLSRNKSGEVTGSLASLEFFGKTRKMMDALLTEMGVALTSGDITCSPTDPSGNYDACQYCDYQWVCPRNRDEAHNKVPKLTAEQRKELLKGGEYHGV